MQNINAITEAELILVEHSLRQWQLNEPSLYHFRVDFRKRLSEIFLKVEKVNILKNDRDINYYIGSDSGSTWNNNNATIDEICDQYERATDKRIQFQNYFNQSVWSDNYSKPSGYSTNQRYRLSTNKGEHYERICTFCKNSHEPRETYKSHTVSQCRILRQYTCKECGERGHTLSHCQKNKNNISVSKLITQYNEQSKGVITSQFYSK